MCTPLIDIVEYGAAQRHQACMLDFFKEPALIIDHIGLAVSDYEASKQFFLKALAPLEIELVMEVDGWAGFGKGEKPEFWLRQHADRQAPMHIAFAANTREKVRAFYEAALEAGGKDNGAPGVRAIYHPNYYGAFILGPDGHNIETVCHTPEI